MPAMTKSVACLTAAIVLAGCGGDSAGDGQKCRTGGGFDRVRRCEYS